MMFKYSVPKSVAFRVAKYTELGRAEAAYKALHDDRISQCKTWLWDNRN